MAARLKLAEAEAEKAAAKTISGAEMKAKKQLLAVKQEILDLEMYLLDLIIISGCFRIKRSGSL